MSKNRGPIINIGNGNITAGGDIIIGGRHAPQQPQYTPPTKAEQDANFLWVLLQTTPPALEEGEGDEDEDE